VEGGQLKKKGKGKAPRPSSWARCPSRCCRWLKQAWGIVVAGVGGTGVITIGQLLGVAAHLEGKGIVTQDAGGLAQKGGATWSHVLIGATQDDIRTTRVSMAAADLIIGCDPIVTAGKETVLRMREGRTHVALNAQGTPTAAFVKNANWQNPSDQCVADITRAVGEAGVGLFNADAVAGKLMGDTIYTNPMMLGYAWQKGWIPLGASRCCAPSSSTPWRWRTTRPPLNGAARPRTTARAVEALLSPGQVVEFKKRETVESLVARRVEFLTAYQDAAYAAQYQAFVEKVRAAEAPLGKTTLTESVARYLFKLMAYKDEYEVARLHTDTALPGQDQRHVRRRLQAELPHGAAADREEERQGRTDQAALRPGHDDRVQAAGPPQGPARRRVRHLWQDRRAQDRACADRRVPRQHRGSAEVTERGNHATAVEIARIPEQIKGFGHVKERHLKAARQNWSALMAAYRAPQGARQAA
jgi:indolepyruvate ferredoxin oxidoreductase